MLSIRTLGVLMVASALAGCTTGATAACSNVCDKEEACGDIDSVKADQCRKQCDANADVEQAALDSCINKSDIISASSQCLDRACSDYAKCLTTIPACKGGFSSGAGTGHPPAGTVSCDSNSGGAHICLDETSTAGSCPSGSTKVSACSSSNRLGRCTLDQSGISLTEYFYAGGGITADAAKSACEQSNGIWTPG